MSNRGWIESKGSSITLRINNIKEKHLKGKSRQNKKDEEDQLQRGFSYHKQK